ncbi:hypothetical protein IWT25_01659 [Secundilactobacillus pentosiphilus]|uniref:DUF3862 domain-containing protein n=1 Tax=Secundilactobacillus pentosiphilus TaxID=1714682 RepID=A0A1Z5IX53_9LACO|nr:DUF3862 domain-containing protein [Secundilactobacillus pentosiphilus]GAX06317.1 hypothetical protein IWT25_01659 [Secundilactobacillus pentosiphilus]
MKKLLITAVALLTTASLAGCGNGTPKSTRSAISNKQSTKAANHKQTQQPQNTTAINQKMTAQFNQIKTGAVTNGSGGSSKAQVLSVMGKPDKESKATKQGTAKGSKVYTWKFSQQTSKRTYKAISIDIVKDKAVSKNAFQVGSSTKIHASQYHHISKGAQLASVKKQLGTPIEEMVMGNKGPYSSQILVYLDKDNQITYTFSFIDQKLMDKSSSTEKNESSTSQDLPSID